MSETTALKRTLGWPALAAYGLGAILGAGIYSVIGAAAERAGAAMWLAFALSALVALVTALAYAELATMYPQAGAEFVYVGHAMPRRKVLAFATGGLMVTSTAATCATVSIAFAGYANAYVVVPTPLAAPVLIAVLTAIAIVGVKEAAWTTALFTAIEVAGLVLVIAVGVSNERFGAALATMPTLDVFPGAALVFFSYLGFENIANLAGEAKRPARDLPRAILLSVGIATLLYVLVALAVLALLPVDELAASDAPLADAVRASSPAIASVLGAIALFATANTAMAAIVSGSRILYAMGEVGAMPHRLAAVSPKRRTPWLATLVVAALAIALLPFGGVAVVASISSFASLLAFAMVNVSLIVLRYREPARERPFRVPLHAGRLPVLPLVGAVAAVVLVTQLDVVALATGAGLLVAVVALYRLVRRSRG